MGVTDEQAGCPNSYRRKGSGPCARCWLTSSRPIAASSRLFSWGWIISAKGSAEPFKITEEIWNDFWADAPFSDLAESGSLSQILAYHAELHVAHPAGVCRIDRCGIGPADPVLGNANPSRWNSACTVSALTCASTPSRPKRRLPCSACLPVRPVACAQHLPWRWLPLKMSPSGMKASGWTASPNWRVKLSSADAEIVRVVG